MHSFSNNQYQPGRLHPNRIVRYSRAHRSSSRPARSRAAWVKTSRPSIVNVADKNPTLSPELQSLRQSALEIAKKGNYAEAIALFDELLVRNPGSATDYNNRGLVHFKCHHHVQALADYDMAIALDATLDGAYNNRANYYAHHGDLLGALLDYDMAIDLNPFNVRAWLNQGITFRDLKVYGRAIECFDSALNFGILHEHVYLERGRTYHLRGDWNCAIADYQRVITYVVEICDQLGEREIRLLTQAEDWLEELLAPLAGF